MTRTRLDALGGSYATSVVHDPSGQASRLTFGNGRTLTQGWNQRGEPLSVQSGPLWLGYVPTPAGDVGAVTDRSEDLSCVREVDYNEVRPHSSLDNQTPKELARSLTGLTSAAVQ